MWPHTVIFMYMAHKMQILVGLHTTVFQECEATQILTLVLLRHLFPEQKRKANTIKSVKTSRLFTTITHIPLFTVCFLRIHGHDNNLKQNQKKLSQCQNP